MNYNDDEKNSVRQTLRSGTNAESILNAVLSNRNSTFFCNADDYERLMAGLSGDQLAALNISGSAATGYTIAVRQISKKDDESASSKKKDDKKDDDENDKKKKKKKKKSKKNKKEDKETKKQKKEKAKKETKETKNLKKDAQNRAKKMDKAVDKSKKASKTKSLFSKFFGSKTSAKTAEKAVSKTVTKTATKTTTKIAGKAVLKSVVKKIPVVSLAAGCVFAVGRAIDGDWKGAVGEVASGAAGCVPGAGTAASIAIDAGLAYRDINNANKTEQNAAENSHKKENSEVNAKSVRVPKNLSQEVEKRYAPKQASFSASPKKSKLSEQDILRARQAERS